MAGDGRAAWTRALTLRTVILAWAFVPIVFFAMYREGQVDPDLWWHLKAGEWMVQNGCVPREEFFSHTAAGHRWVAHEWLTEIVFWILYRLGGMWALVLLQGLLTAATLALVYLVTLGITGNAVATAVSTWLVGLACFPFFRIRPHLFTLVLLGVVFALAFFYTQGYRRVIWMFPVLMMLWVNLHGGYVAGLGMGLALLLYEAGRSLFSRELPPREAWGRLRELLGAGALGVLAVLLNPNGARMWIYPFEYMGDSPYTQGIREWRAPDLASGEFTGFEILLLVGLVTLAVSPRRPHLPSLLLCVALLHQSLTVLRYIPFFALCFGPLLAWHMSALRMPAMLRRRANRRRENTKDAGGVTAERPLLNAVLLALLPLFLAYVASQGLAEPALTDRAYPATALKQMEALGLQGNLFNDYKWGGYVLFHAYPERRVFVDGRADAYDPQIITDYLTVSRLKPGWRDVFERYNIGIILWPAEHAVTEALKLDPTWELRHSDPVAVVFSRRPKGKS